MSSTRRKDPEDETLSQGRYASTSPYSPPLLCNLVVRRARTLKNAEDRALVYFLQQASHREGGIETFAERFLTAFASRIGTPTTRRLGKASGGIYTVTESAAIRQEMPRQPLSWSDFLPAKRLENPADDLTQHPFGMGWIGSNGRRYSDAEKQELDAEYEAAEAERNAPLPCLTVDGVRGKCRAASGELSNFLRELCLDPVIDFADQSRAGVWWFDDLIGALHLSRLNSAATAEDAIAETTISKRVFDDLDYAAFCRGLVVIEGDQRTGKSTAAENWCHRHPGQTVYVKLGTGNDDATFFRSIAKALGTAASLTRKPTEMQMKIEDALQEGHLLLVLDEAHFLFAQTQRPRSAPSRLDWVRTALVDFKVGVALISTPQFDRSCELYEKQLKWNARQIKGRVKLHTLLPTELPVEDLAAVAKKMAPQADDVSLLRLVGFAQSSDDYLAGIERLVERANFFAWRDGRPAADRADIKRALDEALPRVEALPPSEPAKPKGRGSVRATSIGKSAKGFGKTLPPALARRAGLDTLDNDQTVGPGVSERLQFTEAAASD